MRASVVITAASAENVQLVGSGAAELGFTQADVLPTSTAESPAVEAIARVYDDQLHLVTTGGGPVRTVADLRGRRVSVGAAGSGTEITATRLLEVARLGGDEVRRERLGLDDSVAALRSGRIDAFFFSGGLPVRGIEELADAAPPGSSTSASGPSRCARATARSTSPGTSPARCTGWTR